jgi:hypothetical protein
MKTQAPSKAELQRALYAKAGRQYVDLESQLLRSVMD